MGIKRFVATSELPELALGGCGLVLKDPEELPAELEPALTSTKFLGVNAYSNGSRLPCRFLKVVNEGAGDSFWYKLPQGLEENFDSFEVSLRVSCAEEDPDTGAGVEILFGRESESQCFLFMNTRDRSSFLRFGKLRIARGVEFPTLFIRCRRLVGGQVVFKYFALNAEVKEAAGRLVVSFEPISLAELPESLRTKTFWTPRPEHLERMREDLALREEQSECFLLPHKVRVQLVHTPAE
ncbi:MAG TPA: hypothetical protein VMX18_03605 [Candidatus Bipolaricaulota bacterium]|nr:hypothetical protein [Candidatus Bipolaricaulota bacterium]